MTIRYLEGEHLEIARGVTRAAEVQLKPLQGNFKRVKSQRDSSKPTMEKQQTQIRQFQALAFEGMEGDSWASGDDSTVCRMTWRTCTVASRTGQRSMPLGTPAVSLACRSVVQKRIPLRPFSRNCQI
ncbi:hypothetical protein B0H67DRAFT_54323 [Lasiosphaeris hirsuta]|uniref:Uncharacterized protein n=1 Tax=Lasiosphaeris hirsuta TaxID=260670 RepID=A0AA40BBD0_9PEZI|nr:hypothetical protein B0H67DRAFT_54323 [Lasiosphaeris hirsuta]